MVYLYDQIRGRGTPIRPCGPWGLELLNLCHEVILYVRGYMSLTRTSIRSSMMTMRRKLSIRLRPRLLTRSMVSLDMERLG